jgi:iron complex outermembrane receptor protein
MTRGARLVGLVGAVLLSSQEARAEEPRERVLDEIVTTARRREESIQKIPLSATPLSEQGLDERNARRLDEIAPFVPNLQFGPGGGAQNSVRLRIRGIGNEDPIATRDPGVGVYVDGIYLARSQGPLLGLADVERVEVLRGPQGTLFGRNTIGGAIHVITRKPVDELTGSASVRVGRFDLLETRASLNVPLVSETAAARVAFQSVDRDGYSRNELTGQETDDGRLLAGRAALQLWLSDDLELSLVGEQARAHAAGRGGECRLAPGALPSATLIQLEIANGFDFPARCLESQADDELDYASPVRSKDNLDASSLAATLTWGRGELRVRSLSAWRQQRTSGLQDLSFERISPGRLNFRRDTQRQLSQELLVDGRGLGGRLSWTLGALAFLEETRPGPLQAFVGSNLCAIAPEELRVPGLPPGALPPAAAQGLSQRICSASVDDRTKTDTSAWAAFGQASYDLSPEWHVTAGLRRSLERKRYRTAQSRLLGPGQLGAPFLSDTSARFDKWTPLVSLSRDLSDDVRVYASWSRGFKSGGFNGRPAPDLPSTLEPFSEERLDSYELGLKASFLDGAVVGSAAVFHGRYRDIQLTTLAVDRASGAIATRVANAGRAVVQGGELELRALLPADVELALGVGATDAEYREFDDLVDRSDEDFTSTPRWSAHVSAGRTFRDVAGLGDLALRVTWYEQDEVNFGPVSDTLEQSRYGLLGARLALALPDGRTELVLAGQNLLDRRYLNDGNNFESGAASSVAHYGVPRTWTLEVRRTF